MENASLLSHAMKECQVANFHGQASDAYVYVWMVPENASTVRIGVDKLLYLKMLYLRRDSNP